MQRVDVLLVGVICSMTTARAESSPTPSSLYQLSANDLVTNEVVPLSRYEGMVSLVVNVASA